MGQSASTKTEHRTTWRHLPQPIRALQLIITTHLWRMQKEYKTTCRSSVLFFFSQTLSSYFQNNLISISSFLQSCKLTNSLTFINITSQSSKIDVISNQTKWSTLLPPAARPPMMALVSVPPRPSAPVASRAPWTAAATRLLPRTLFRVPAAHAVCNSTILIIQVKLYTNIFEIGSRPAGQCTCERSVTENQAIAGETCACGSRPQGKF